MEIPGRKGGLCEIPSVVGVWRFSGTIHNVHCAVPEKKLYSQHRRKWNFLGDGGSGRPKDLKKCIKQNWNFHRGGEVLEKKIVGRNYTLSIRLSKLRLRQLCQLPLMVMNRLSNFWSGNK